jgi:pimeloyl-ACP methyl ester carboxylesterase
MVEYASGELRPVEDAIMNLRSISSKQNDVKVIQVEQFPLPGHTGVKVTARQSEQPEWVSSLKTDHAPTDDSEYWQTLLRQISILWWTPLHYTAEDFHNMIELTLILIGDRDGLIELKQAVDMYQLIPNAELVVLPNATHFSTLRETSMNIVLDFLLRHAIAAKKPGNI